MGQEYCTYCYASTRLNYGEKLFGVLQEKYKVPPECMQVFYEKGFYRMPRCFYNVWLKNNILAFFPSYPKKEEELYSYTEIPIKNIEYFTVQEALNGEIKIPGGGNSLKGGEKKGEENDRKTALNFYLDGIRRSMFFKYDDYRVFYGLIPEKAQSNVRKS